MASGIEQFSCGDYHVAWICPLADVELLPARLMLDEEYPTPQYDTHYDENTYICGVIHKHTVVIATCPRGETGNVSGGRLTGSMFKTFPNIRMAVLVGIGSGIPSSFISGDPLGNIHLGDVVVGCSNDGKPACVYHDRGKSKVGEFEMVGTMKNADWRLTNALDILVSDHELERTTFDDQLARLKRFKVKGRFAHPGREHDRLFEATHHHADSSGSDCTACDRTRLVQRPQRSETYKHELVFHRGRIATGNAIIQDGELRDNIRAQCDGPLCVETEAAGVDVNRQCLVIRGISDYADSHKNDMWKSYAAGRAAAFTRELLCKVQPSSNSLRTIDNASRSPQGSAASSGNSISADTTLLMQLPSNNGGTIVKVPKISREWSSAEDKRLQDVVQVMGPKWKHVAQHFHRDDWACRKRYEKLAQRYNHP
jgi:nucleoside phosphorylase